MKLSKIEKVILQLELAIRKIRAVQVSMPKRARQKATLAPSMRQSAKPVPRSTPATIKVN